MSCEIGKIVNGNTVVEEILKFGIVSSEELSTEFVDIVLDPKTRGCCVESVFDSALKVSSVPRTPLDVLDPVFCTATVSFGPLVPASSSGVSTISPGNPVLISEKPVESADSSSSPDVSEAGKSLMNSVVRLTAICAVTAFCCVNSSSLKGSVDMSSNVDVMMVDVSEKYSFDSSTPSDSGV